MGPEGLDPAEGFFIIYLTIKAVYYPFNNAFSIFRIERYNFIHFNDVRLRRCGLESFALLIFNFRNRIT